MLRDAQFYLKISATYIYNLLWTQKDFIHEWTEAVVIPICKNTADNSLLDSYRPIALTAAMCKLMERLAANRLFWYLESNNLLNPVQTGFRRSKNTLDKCCGYTIATQKGINNKGFTQAVFLDFSKAFDTMWNAT